MRSKHWIPTLALSAFALVTAALADGVDGARTNPTKERTAARVEENSNKASAGDLRRWLADREALESARQQAETRSERHSVDARLRDSETDLVDRFGPTVAGKVLALTDAPADADASVRIATNR